MSLQLSDLLTLGYFPAELPPPFNTVSFGQYASANYTMLHSTYQSSQTTKAAVHNLARTNSLRRKLSIPNPIWQMETANCIAQNWFDLEQLTSASALSATSPKVGTNGRAIEPKYSRNELLVKQAGFRSSRRFLLKTDISRCYPSIYTHSIAWAIDTRTVAKASRNNRQSLGNKLDYFIRQGQDQQTMGIPISPDTSMVVAEVILSAIDKEFLRKGVCGSRYLDDYEFCFHTRAEAEEFLSEFQEILNSYELAANPSKTSVVELPQPMNPAWMHEIRSFKFRSNKLAQYTDIIKYFDTSFDLSKNFSDDAVLRYAVMKLSSEDFNKENWVLLESLMLQSVAMQPSLLRVVLSDLEKRIQKGYNVNLEALSEVLNYVVQTQSPLGHGSEVAWSLWGMIMFSLPLTKEALKAVSTSQDPFVALLVLDARSKKLIDLNFDLSQFASRLTQDDLFEEHWLLAYECDVQNFGIGANSGYVDKTDFFQHLKKSGVSFYNSSASIGPLTPSPQTIFDTGGSKA